PRPVDLLHGVHEQVGEQALARADRAPQVQTLHRPAPREDPPWREHARVQRVEALQGLLLRGIGAQLAAIQQLTVTLGGTHAGGSGAGHKGAHSSVLRYPVPLGWWAGRARVPHQAAARAVLEEPDATFRALRHVAHARIEVKALRL